MQRHSIPSHTYCGRQFAAPIFFSILALLLITALLHRSARERQLRQLAPIAQQALSLCSAFSDDCRTTETPMLLNVGVTQPDGTHKVRSIWSVDCIAQGREYALQFHAATGQLCTLFAQGRNGKSRFTEPRTSQIRTPIQAAEAAMTLLRRMAIVPPGGKVALERTPSLLHGRHAWQIIWKVRRPETPQVTRIKMMLDQYSGVPLLVVDTYAMNALWQDSRKI